jgi:hypothetical protein
MNSSHHDRERNLARNIQLLKSLRERATKDQSQQVDSQNSSKRDSQLHDTQKGINKGGFIGALEDLASAFNPVGLIR